MKEFSMKKVMGRHLLGLYEILRDGSLVELEHKIFRLEISGPVCSAIYYKFID